MEQIAVRIVKLEPLHVVSFHGFGPSPEDLAWQQLAAWAKPRGLLDYSPAHRIFGFNNPDPAPGSPNYGYEFWLTVGPEMQPEGDVKVQTFPGGLYAVARCVIRNDAYEVIGATWKQLVAWREASRYKEVCHQCLEEHIEVNEPGRVFALDLYLPIAE